MKYSFKKIAAVLIPAFASAFVSAGSDLDTFNQYNPISDYIGVAQQGSNFYVSCDSSIKDCPIRTLKHRDMHNSTNKPEPLIKQVPVGKKYVIKQDMISHHDYTVDIR